MHLSSHLFSLWISLSKGLCNSASSFFVYPKHPLCNSSCSTMSYTLHCKSLQHCPFHIQLFQRKCMILSKHLLHVSTHQRPWCTNYELSHPPHTSNQHTFLPSHFSNQCLDQSPSSPLTQQCIQLRSVSDPRFQLHSLHIRDQNLLSNLQSMLQNHRIRHTL